MEKVLLAKFLFNGVYSISPFAIKGIASFLDSFDTAYDRGVIAVEDFSNMIEGEFEVLADKIHSDLPRHCARTRLRRA
jgi:hypothetical protein